MGNPKKAPDESEGSSTVSSVRWDESTSSWIATGTDSDGVRIRRDALKMASAVRRLGVRLMKDESWLEKVRWPAEMKADLRAYRKQVEEIEATKETLAEKQRTLEKQICEILLRWDKRFNVGFKETAKALEISKAWAYVLIDKYRGGG